MEFWINQFAGRMCRLSSGSTDFGHFGAVRFDHGGVPVPARAKSNNMWQLSDNGEGARALIVYGSPQQIAAFFRENADKGIDNGSLNTFSGRPDIYMSTFDLATTARYRSMYPYNEAAVRSAKFANGVFSSPSTFGAFGLKTKGAVASRMAASVGKLASKLHKEVLKVRNPGFAASAATQSTGMFAVKFWHLPFEGARKVGTGSVYFRDIEFAG